jgi:hypothetical protein
MLRRSNGTMARLLDAHRCGDKMMCRLPDDLDLDFMGHTDLTALRRPAELIFLVDCSLSMTSAWPALAAAVNQALHSRRNSHILKWASLGCVRPTALIGDIYQCARKDEGAGRGTGFGTNITAAATMLLEYLRILRSQGCREFIVVFVSDGQGTVDNLEEVCNKIRTECLAVDEHETEPILEFTAVGVGRLFPTSVAMQFRNALHNGSAAIPLVTLVDSNEEFEDAFDGLSDIWTERRSVRFRVFDTAATLTPWGEFQESIHVEPGQSFIIPDATESVSVCLESGPGEGWNPIVCRVRSSAWTDRDAVDTFKQYLWELQAEGLQMGVRKEDVKGRAAVALEDLMIAAVEVSSEGRDDFQTVNERVARKLHRGLELVLSGLEREFRFLVEGSILTDLSDQELAQRLAIGTMEGKYHAKALSWKGLSLSDFIHIRDEFVSLLDNIELLSRVEAVREEEENAGLRSAILLESNSDVLNERGLGRAISKITSQYFLVDVLPVVGLAVKLERSNASMINPWAVRVRFISAHSPVLDTLSLLRGGSVDSIHGVQVEMSAGSGESEVMNSVCCLVSSAKCGEALKPFLTSRLYQVLHTHCACGNTDTLDRGAHPALLAAVLCFMLADIENGICRESWMETVHVTLRELYPSYGTGRGGFVAAMLSDPGSAMVTESPLSSIRCQSMSKPIALALSWKHQIPMERRLSIVDHISKEWIGRALGDKRKWDDWFELEEIVYTSSYGAFDTTVDVYEKLYRRVQDLGPFFLLSAAEKVVRAVMARVRIRVQAGRAILKSASMGSVHEFRDGAVTFQTIRSFGRLFLDDVAWDLTEEDVTRYLFHSIEFGRSSRDREGDAVPCISWELAEKLYPIYASNKARYVLRGLLHRVRREFLSEMESGHDRTPENWPRPASLSEILAIRRNLNLPDADAVALGYRADVGLCRCCCMFPKCPLYMVIPRRHRDVGQHLSDALSRTGGVVPGLSVTVARCVDSGLFDIEEIYRRVEDGRYMLRSDDTKRAGIPAQLARAKEFYLSSIRGALDFHRAQSDTSGTGRT